MSLYCTGPKFSTTGPCLHAFIIGVGEYPHLGGGAAQPAAILNMLEQLAGTPRAAKNIAHWLETEYQNPARPLGTVELLLSPAEKLKRADGTDVEIEAATMANIEAAFKRWLARCDAHADNIAFFYFAGHGVSRATHLLLARDFGDPANPDEWENCVDFTNFKEGMRKCKAQVQVYFVDACRNTPYEVLKELNPHGKPLITSTGDAKVRLSAAYLAASEGRQAYGPTNDATYFSQALLLCLRGAGARNVGPGVRWQVDTANLSSSLLQVISVMASVHGEPLTGECVVQPPIPLHYPQVGKSLLHVTYIPEHIGAQSVIRVRQGGKTTLSPATDPRPWMEHIDPGQTRVEVDLVSHPQEIQDHEALPPTCVVEVIR